VKRGELYLVKKPAGGDPKKQRVFVVVSRQGLLDTAYSCGAARASRTIAGVARVHAYLVAEYVERW